MKRYVLTIFLLLPVLVSAETRVAFLVGNSEYEHTASLANPVSDVALIGSTLTDLGFEVHQRSNLTRNEIGQELSDFLKATEGADVTLFYFAGHGMQYKGSNYLIGTDGRLATEFDVESEALNLDSIVNLLERNSRAAMVFVDACRNNPLADRFYRENFSETRALMTRGLAPITTAFEGTMMTFSASPGQVAYDGEGNSPFAVSLARHLPTENIEILSVMKRVIRDVRNLTDNQQTPMLMNDLTTEIYLNLGDGDAGTSIAYEQEQTMFQAALLMQSSRAWNLYFQQFPDGFFKDMARMEQARVFQLENEDPNASGFGDGGDDAFTGSGGTGLNLEVPPVSPPEILDTIESTLVVAPIKVQTPEITNYSSRHARYYDPIQVASIENDVRLVSAIKELQHYKLVYGLFEGRVYLALILEERLDLRQANLIAASVGGHLVSINSEMENEFVLDLVLADKGFWWGGTSNSANGPIIGLSQINGAREPSGGWVWSTGEKTNYLNWATGFPSNNIPHGADIAGFGNSVNGLDSANSNLVGKWKDYTTIERSFIIEIE